MEQEVQKEEPKWCKAKTWSLIGKIVGGIVILAGFVLKWTKVFPDATTTEILGCGFGIMGVFGTIDINLIIDKFVK